MVPNILSVKYVNYSNLIYLDCLQDNFLKDTLLFLFMLSNEVHEPKLSISKFPKLSLGKSYW